jgi:GDP-L-fucose synthase
LQDSDDIDRLAEWFAGAVVFHLAARVTNIRENRHDHLGMLQDNIRINANVVEAARYGRPKLLELTSTVCVYPHDAPAPTMEQHAFPFHPEDTNEGYGLAKAILEKQGEYLYREHGIPVIVPRFANAFGPRDYYDRASSHVAPALIRKAFEDEIIEVWGSGEQTRTLMDARDLAETLCLLAEEPEAQRAQPVNLGWGDPVSIGDLAYLILKLAGMERKEVRFDKSQPDGHKARDFCCGRLVDLVGWPPCRPVEDTLADMIAEFAAGEARL